MESGGKTQRRKANGPGFDRKEEAEYLNRKNKSNTAFSTGVRNTAGADSRQWKGSL